MVIDEQGKILNEFHTMGFNPYFHDADLVESKMRESEDAVAIAGEVSKVYFYGAGSSSAVLCKIIQSGLNRVFSAANVHVGHDLDAAAYSTYAGEPAITCIIGTGSNSCYFDGDVTSEKVPALAYILGDEASGSWFGKRLLALHLYQKLDPIVEADFVNTFGFSKDDIVNRVYQEPDANVFLASFMTFIARHQEVPQIISLLEEGFQAFVDVHVKCYENYQNVPVHFVGSVAYHFQPVLCHVCEREGIAVGQIIKRPIDGLAEYHLKYILNV
ncbi:MAG TPA: N-acetylglucosamine kinase [Flavobacteriales bacterium]|nr:N-acetylglucosamine kinase [Flavobacteriales bacterium]|tara:strand:+ start:1106 stop:1921 length:816 start_codon:yes stop_codon:yes gene_type:complete